MVKCRGLKYRYLFSTSLYLISQFQESGQDITELILQEFTFHLQKALLNLGIIITYTLG